MISGIVPALLVLSVAHEPPTIREAPAVVVIATSRGERTVPVSVERGHPVLPVADLGVLLPVSAEVDVDWAGVEFAGQLFRFLLDAPLFQFQNRIIPLVGYCSQQVTDKLSS